MSVSRIKLQSSFAQHASPIAHYFAVAFVAIISLAGLLLLVQMSGVTATSYDVRRLEEERNDWQQVNYQLELYVASLQSLDRIEREARGRLGMVPASGIKFVRVNRLPPVPADLRPPGHAKQRVPQSAALAWSDQARRAVEDFILQLTGRERTE